MVINSEFILLLLLTLNTIYHFIRMLLIFHYNYGEKQMEKSMYAMISNIIALMIIKLVTYNPNNLILDAVLLILGIIIFFYIRNCYKK